MNKLTHVAMALANNTLSKRAMSHVKGGIDTSTSSTTTSLVETISSIVEDEKRRERPGGGINTN